MLARAHAAGLPFAWVTGDSVYGADSALRRWLQAQGLGYVLAVTKAQRLGFSRVEDRVIALPPTAWQRLSAGDGAMIGGADHPSPPGRGCQRPRGAPGATTGPICPTAATPHPAGRKAC